MRSERGNECRVLLVDDNPAVQRAVEPVLVRWGCTLVGSLESADELAPEVVRQHPDIVLLDIDMPGRSALHAISDLRYRGSRTRVLVFSAMSDAQTVAACMQAGAAGYVLKADAPEALREGIVAVHGGRTYLSPSVVKVTLKGETRSGEGPRSAST